MELKMYQFDGSCMTWICAENEQQAINLFKFTFGADVWEESKECYGDAAVIELSDDHIFNYYHDGYTAVRDTIENHIRKYCTKPDIFATSEF